MNVLFCIVFVSSNAYSMNNAVLENRYAHWLHRYGRRYGSRDEWEMRFGIYQSNLQLVDLINSQNLSYKLSDNKYADMTNMEFQSTFFGYKRSKRLSSRRDNSTTYNLTIPNSVDWRKMGAVTRVKNQGDCGIHFCIFIF